MDEMKSRVYALIENGVITRIEGEYTLPTDLTGWSLIEEGQPCDRLNLAQSHYLPKPLMDENGVYRYKLTGAEENSRLRTFTNLPFEIVERTQEEIDADFVLIPKPKKSTLELLVDALEANKPTAEKEGFELVLKSNDGMIVWEYIAIETPSQEDGTYLHPFTYQDEMEVVEFLWYTDGENIWECIKSGIPSGFNDGEYFDIIEVTT